MTAQLGQLFGNYCVVRLIGEGGFGEVYLVENKLIQRRAAVKVLHPALAQDEELVRRFLNEARAASAICHRNIVEVLDAGWTSDGVPYILMEFLEGISLQKRLADSGRQELSVVLDLANQAGSALVAAHAAGIVHRDLKPENLFLVPDAHAPGGERIKVLDFGIAKIRLGGGSGGTVRTRTGMIVGSPAYMSPEQCKDSADVDVRSDVYSFATILYEMLAGKTPHVAETGTELLLMHLTKTPAPLRALAPQVPATIEAAVMRALAKDRDDRFDSMELFIDALQKNLTAPAPKRVLSTEILSEGSYDQTGSGNRPSSKASRTTLSAATGELGESEGSSEIDEVLLSATRKPRWPVIAIGVGLAIGCAMLLLLRPSNQQQPRSNSVASAAASAAAASPSLPNAQAQWQKDEPKLDNGGATKPIGESQHALTTGDSPPPPTSTTVTGPSQNESPKRPHPEKSSPIKKRNSVEQWLAH